MEPVAKAEKNVGRADKLTQVSIFVADEWEPGVFVSLTPAVAGLLALLVPTGGVGTACARRRCRHRQSARAWMSQVRAPNDGSESLLSMLLALGARVPHFLIVWWQRSNMSQERWCSIWGRDDEWIGAGRSCACPWSHQGDMGHWSRSYELCTGPLGF
jgi:hypothetical protein